jgi:hypothetical protein
MRLYGGRILKSRVSQQITNRQEMRDAIVISVDSTNKYAMVKIQGSNTSIKAWYPENWESTPVYLKPGNSVRINQPGGNKSRIEITGMGVLLPTAVPGGSVTPASSTLTDTVLTGMVLMPPSDGSMTAWCYTGTYRIGGVTYTFSGLTMDNSAVVMDRPDLLIDSVGGSVSFDAAHATLFRYDKVVVGTDGVLDVVKGSNYSGEPTMPATTVDHVFVGWVLIYPGMTSVTAADVNRTYSAPVLSDLKITYEDQELDYGDNTTYFDVTPLDQYNQTLADYYEVTLSIVLGTGTFTAPDGTSTCSADGYVDIAIPCTTGFRVQYARETGVTESSPTFTLIDSYTSLIKFGGILLKDSGGNPLGAIYA